MAKRFIFAFITFIGLVFPAAFALALLAAPARPAPLEQAGLRPDPGRRLHQDVRASKSA